MRYTLAAKAYGKEVGDTIDLDRNDPNVALNVAAHVLVPDETVAEKMTCPWCADHMKRPPKLAGPDELHAHYEDKHPGLVTPPWAADN